MMFQGNKYGYFIAILVNTLGFLVGISLSWTSPMLGKLSDTNTENNPLGRPITDDEESWIGSLISLGACFSPFLIAYLMDKIGRKPSVLVVNLLFLVSFLICTFAENIYLFYVARIFMGFGIGATFTICPAYIIEISETANRGILSALTTSFIMIGILCANSVGPYVSMFVFNIIFSVISFVFFPIWMYVAPETPYYLCKVHKDEAAAEALMFLRRTSKKVVEEELTQIKNFLEHLQKGSISDLFKVKASRKALIFSVVLTSLQQLSGITIVIAFSQQIFKSAGMTDIAPEICSIIVSSVQCFTSFITPLLNDRCGRRKLLIFSTFGAFIAELVLGTYFCLSKNDYNVDSVNWLPVLCLVFYILFYNFGFGAIPWGLMGELLPTNIISEASSITTSIYWIIGFLMAKFYGSVSDSIGLDGSFWIFSVFCISCTVFTYFFVIETKGKTLAEIREILSK